jgi:hypothetical protein
MLVIVALTSTYTQINWVPGTDTAQAVPATIGQHKVILVDTPGFDDSKRSDSDILTEISRLLAFQYEAGLSLKGVIYLHRITDIRYQGSSVKTLNIFQKICGKNALKNVMLVTTRWNEVEESIGASRERELRDQFWKYMLGNGSTMMRYYGDEDSALTIASQLLSKSTIILDLQRELVDEGKTLDRTAAGSLVNDNIEDLKAKYEQELADLETLRRSLIESDREMKRQIQKDWEREQEKLEQARAQQVSLRADVGNQVRQEIRQETRKRSSLGMFLPLLPTVLNLLGMFVGIPPGSFDILTSWFSNTGFGESFTDFFSSF